MKPITIQLTQKPLDPSPTEEAAWIREWTAAAYYVIGVLEGETLDATAEDMQALFPELEAEDVQNLARFFNHELANFSNALASETHSISDR